MPVTTLREQSKIKVARYCAYQERTQQEVRNKLYSYGLAGDVVEDLLAELITEGFVNEDRYAKAFCRGKFTNNKWGRVKITLELRQKKISEYCIRTGLQEIEEEDYLRLLKNLVDQKWKSLKGEDAYVRKNKTARYAIGKGFEPELVWQAIGE